MLLVGLGAEVNAVDNKEFTPLHHAALEGRATVIRTLIGLGAEKEAKNENGLTPLQIAAFKGHTEVSFTLPHIITILSKTLTLVHYSLIYILRERGRLWSWEQT